MKTLKLSIIAILILLGNMLYAQNAAVSVPLTVTDNAGGTQTLYFGLDPTATDGIDAALGEAPLPPLPPAGVFDARFNVINNESTVKDYRTGTATYVGQKTYEVQYQVGTGANITLSWDLPEGITGSLKDVVLGTIINVPMQGTGNYTVANPGVFSKLNMIIDYSLLPNPPLPPNLSTPANNSVGVVLNPVLTWEASLRATSYHVIIATDNAFTNVVLEDTNVAGLTKQLNNLSEETEYFWKVRAKNAGGNSDFSSVWSFTTGSKPTQVTLQTPQNNATGVGLTPSLEWSPATGTLPFTYTLEVATDANFNTIVITQNGLNTNSFNVVNPLNQNTDYWWRVKAVNSFGNGPLSTVSKFTTGTTPNQVTLTAPANNATEIGLKPQFTWTASTTGTAPIKYNLLVATDAAFANVVVNQANINTNSYTLTNSLALNTLYYWKIVPSNTFGNGPESAVWSFRTSATVLDPAVNVPFTVSDNGTGNQVLYFGLDPIATDGIDPTLGEAPLPPLPPAGVFDARFNVINNESTVKDYRNGTANFVGPKEYEVQYQVGTGNQITIAWNMPEGVTGVLKDVVTGTLINVPMTGQGNHIVTNPGVFNKLKVEINYNLAPPAQPTLISPLNESVGLTQPVNLLWRKAEGASKYVVQVATDNQFNNIVYQDENVTDTTKSVSGLNNLTQFFWRVKAKNAHGESDWTAVWNFKTLGVPTNITLLNPANAAVNQPINMVFNWSKSFDQTEVVSNYWFEMVTDPGTMAGLVRDTLLTDTTKSVNGLSYSTTYYWRVKSKNQAGWNAFTAWNNFTTIIEKPSNFTLSLPANNSVGNVQPIVLKWNKSERVEKYTLQVSLTDQFTTLVLSDTELTDTTKTLTGLDNLTQYFWRVKARNVGGESDWTAVWNFKTLGVPTNITLLNPANEAVNQPINMVFNWSKSFDQTEVVSNYWFEMVTDPGTMAGLVRDTLLTDTTKSVNGLSYLTKYYWRVKSKNQAGWNAFTAWNNFTTIIEKPSNFTLSLPANNSVGNAQPLVIKWNKSERVEKYILQVSLTNQFTTIAFSDSMLTDTTKTLTGLDNLTQYFWRVKARNVGGESDWTAVWNFKTLGVPTNITLLNPANAAVNQPINMVFNWSKSFDQTEVVSNYWFEMVTDPGTMAGLVRDTLLTDTTKSVNGLSYSTTYYWRVKSKNQAGWNAFTAWNNFTTIIEKPSNFTLSLPANNSVGNVQPIVLKWNKSQRVEKYILQVSLSNQFTTLVLSDSMLTDTTKTLTGLDNLTQYFWRVKAKNFGGESDWTAVWNFKTLGVPTTVTLVNPANNAVNQPKDITFKWTKAVDQTEIVTKYWFELVKDTTAMVYTSIDTTLTDTMKLVTNLEHLKKYYWRVKSTNEIGWSGFTQWNNFTIIDSFDINWCNLQWPPQHIMQTGDTLTVYAQVYINGITPDPGPSVGLKSWIGVSTTNTNPETWTNWIPAVFNVQSNNNDEFMGKIGYDLPPGKYYYASKFQYFEGPFRYGGLNNGFWDSTAHPSGVLEVAVGNFPIVEGFENAAFPPAGWAIENANGGTTWIRSTAAPRTGLAHARYPYHTSIAANDWLFTPGMILQAGKKYQISYWYSAASSSYPEKMKVVIGDAQNAAGMDSVLADHSNIIQTTYQNNSILFIPTASGQYFIGFNAYSDADMWNLNLDDITISLLPDVDYTVVSLAQVNGIPNPYLENSNNNVVKEEYETAVNTNQLNFVNRLNSNVGGVIVSDDISIDNHYIEGFKPIELKAAIKNVGSQSPEFNFNYKFNGVAGTQITRPGIPTMTSDTLTLNPPVNAIGTFTIVGNVKATGDSVTSNDTLFNHKVLVYPEPMLRLKYDNGGNTPNTFIGLGVSTDKITAAVRYTSGIGMMRLASVDAFYRTENANDSILVRIWASNGTTTSPGILLYSKKFAGNNYLNPGTVGNYITLPLGNNAPVVQEESDFWVSITFSSDIQYPMGAHNAGFAAGRSFIAINDTAWAPLVITTERAWLMRVVGIPYTPPQYSTIWQNGAANGSLPQWFSTSHLERGLAYGKTNPNTEVNDRLYIASRNGGNFIRIVNAETGSDIGALNTTGISGGTYLINDVETTEDGRIFVCNLTTNASTSPFKVYMWENESSAPTVAVNWTGTDAVRLGDKFTVTGRFSDNSAVIYAASASSGLMKVYKWTMTSGAFNANPEVIVLSDNQSGTPSSASVGPLPNGDFYWKATGFRLKKYTATGTLIDTIPGSVLATGSNAVRYIGNKANKEYVAVFQYGAGNENARIIEITNGNYAGAVTYEITPTLGPNANTNGAGDVSVKHHTDGSVTLFILSTNNGFGSYRFMDIPIELESFTASTSGNGVVLNWTTATETNSKEFVIERSGSDAQWSEIGKVNASGTSTSPVNYSFMDNSVNSGKLIYRLKMVDFDGSYKYSQEVSVEVGVPNVFSLSQNYPNPFNPSTRIQFQIPVNASVTLELFDITGQKIATLINQDIQAGYHIYDLEANRFGIASGVYLYRLVATDKSTSKIFTDTKKLMMLK